MTRTKQTLEAILTAYMDKAQRQHDELDKRLDNIEKVLIAQEINLKDHMRRSDQLEALMDNLQEKELKPLQKHVNMVEGVFKFLGLIALGVTIISGLAKLFGIV